MCFCWSSPNPRGLRAKREKGLDGHHRLTKISGGGSCIAGLQVLHDRLTASVDARGPEHSIPAHEVAQPTAFDVNDKAICCKAVLELAQAVGGMKHMKLHHDPLEATEHGTAGVFENGVFAAFAVHFE